MVLGENCSSFLPILDSCQKDKVGCPIICKVIGSLDFFFLTLNPDVQWMAVLKESDPRVLSTSNTDSNVLSHRK